MPKWFKSYLEGLPNDLATELFDWFDGDPDCVHETIQVLGEESERRKTLGI